jgi:hypothetical protein
MKTAGCFDGTVSCVVKATAHRWQTPFCVARSLQLYRVVATDSLDKTEGRPPGILVLKN